jgi:glycosyltransferase involved in cell wall biosynthesis
VQINRGLGKAMKISIIIPVYNAEKYVKRAVESALQQKECGEVILVEDKSPDNALEICKDMAERHEKVKLFQHEDKENHGPGISRNLGIRKAGYDYIAFLDADDFYLPNRFSRAAEIFSGDPAIDGVYEAVGCQFENEEARKRYFATHKVEIAVVNKPVDPEKLFYYLISGKYGYIHPNGFAGKKDTLIKVGMFPDLRLHEDTALFFKLAVLCRLAAGEIEKPVSLRHLHLQNTITKPGIDLGQSRLLQWQYLVNWMQDNKVDGLKLDLAKTRYYRHKCAQYKRKNRIIAATLYYIYYQLFFKRYEIKLNNPQDL